MYLLIARLLTVSLICSGWCAASAPAPKDLSLIERECYEKIRDNSTFDPRAALDEVKV